MNVRALRKVTGLVLLGGIVYVGWLLSRMDRRPSASVHEEQAAPGQVPAKPEEESGCFDDLVFDWAGDRIEAGRACKRPDGMMQLQRVTLRRRGEDGSEQMTVTADRGLKGDQPTRPVELIGHVHVETPQGLKVDSEALLYDVNTQQVRTDQPVTFSQGDLSGRAGKLVHDGKNERTVLENEPELTLAGERTKGREVTLRGQRLDYDARARKLASAGGATLDFPEGTIAGETIDVLLADAAEEVRRISAVGAASTTITVEAGAGGGSGPAMERTLVGRRIDHDFLPGSRLDVVDAAGGARLDGRSLDPSLGVTEVLEGEHLVLDFTGGDPVGLDSIAAQGGPARFKRDEPGAHREVVGADLRLDSGKDGPESLVVKGAASVRDENGALRRLLLADNADITFAPGGMQLRKLVFSGKPGRLEESAEGDPSRTRTVVARDGDLTFDGAGSPVGGTLKGSVEILDGGTRASADTATLQESPRRTVLKGNAAVERDGRTSHGDEIVRDTDAGLLTVTGNQHTLVHDAKGIPGMEAGGSDEPILISSDTLVLHEKERRAVYEGGRPSLRRGDTELVAAKLDLDDAAGTLDATGNVTSRLRLAQPGADRPADDSPFDPTRLVDGKAEEFHYRRDARVVSYVGAASLEQEDTVLTAQRIDIQLTDGEPARVESLRADGSAFFKAPSRGEAEGERLRWLASDDSVRVEGGARPARARDKDGNFQTGAVVEMAGGGVRALASTAGRARGSSPALKAPQP